MASFLDELFGLETRSPEQLMTNIKEHLNLLDELWADDDRDCRAVRAYIASQRMWFKFMEDERKPSEPGLKVNRILAEELGEFMEHSQKTLQMFILLGRLRCDAIEAATGTNPVPTKESAEPDIEPPTGWERHTRDSG